MHLHKHVQKDILQTSTLNVIIEKARESTCFIKVDISLKLVKFISIIDIILKLLVWRELEQVFSFTDYAKLGHGMSTSYLFIFYSDANGTGWFVKW